ncbi:hypothetical protein GGI19_003173 [Coemansia pectinata]|uniref:Uncharacterized protein n=1 Tax=Coemansia pectinata TaxID=1052879 RepID=A0A9W8GUR2_9FUNG|nr:hypothetical protein GGI19_003173 [Coemansia pectinata]
MFPSLGLLSKIDCPHKDKCGRGTLCLYRHRPMSVVSVPVVIPETTATAINKKKPEAPPQPQPPKVVENAQIVTPKAVTSVPQPAIVVAQEPVNSTAAILVESNPVLAEKKEQVIAPPVASDPACDTDAWRALTLNYDATGPAYNSECETIRVVPQLKAIVGDRIGYPKRQRALTLIYEHTAAKNPEGPSWMAAKLAVECEDRIYRESGAGSYHGKLAVCLRSLKKID